MIHLPQPGKLLLIIAVSLSAPAQSAEWWAAPEVSLTSSYNDNIRLSPTPESSVWETALSPSVRFGVAKANKGLTGNARARIRRFTGGTGVNSSDLLNREDYLFSTDAYHQTERNLFGANIDLVRDSTLDSELDETGIVDRTRATRLAQSLGVSWGRSLTQKMRFNFGYQYNNIKFPDDPGIRDLIPYTSDSVSASLGYQFSNRTQFNLATARSSFKPSTGFNSETLSIQAGINRSFSETLFISFLAGQRETTSDTLFPTGICIGADPGATFPECAGGIERITGSRKGEIKTSGPTYTASITKFFETGSINAALTRSTRPNSNGQLLDSDRFVLNGEHSISTKLRSSLRVSYTESDTIVNVIGREANDLISQKFFRITPQITWDWLREWSISGRYEYARSENRQLQTATRNAVYLSLIYRPTQISISR